MVNINQEDVLRRVLGRLVHSLVGEMITEDSRAPGGLVMHQILIGKGKSQKAREM